MKDGHMRFRDLARFSSHSALQWEHLSCRGNNALSLGDAMPCLLRLIGERNEFVSDAAIASANALIRRRYLQEGGLVDDLLYRLVQNHDPSVRCRGLSLLVNIPVGSMSPNVVSLLLSSLKDVDVRVRLAAIGILSGHCVAVARERTDYIRTCASRWAAREVRQEYSRLLERLEEPSRGTS
jgi:hypothetical protein